MDEAPRGLARALGALELRVPPPLVALAIAAGMWGGASTGPAMGLDGSTRSVLALAIALLALAFDATALLGFLRRRTTINPMRPERSRALVTGGAYRFSRNPMYLGLALLLIASAVALGSWPMLAGPALFVAWITRFQILPEERVLHARFGDEYARYAARVRRWL